jgi:hypothetical protein
VPLTRVLVVESTSVRNLIGAVLERERYTVVLADVALGQKLLQTDADRFDLLITNEPWYFEPFESGLSILYVSGAPDREFLQKHRSPTFSFLAKPFRFQELLSSAQDLILAREDSLAIAGPYQSRRL